MTQLGVKISGARGGGNFYSAGDERTRESETRRIGSAEIRERKTAEVGLARALYELRSRLAASRPMLSAARRIKSFTEL